ncbi:MAG: phasin family protein [Alphaproteobacteria bacterium]|nr:phasin family protein [Alphaproteobacteria bacterium]
MATRKTKVTKPRATQVEAAVKNGAAAVETAVKAGTDAAAQNVEKAVKMTQDQAEKANAQALKAFDEVYAFNKQNLDAFVAAGDVYLRGVEAINAAFISTARRTVEAGLSNTKAVLSAKTFNEVVDLQNDFARKTFDEVVAETTKLSELTSQVANEAAKPISVRVQKTFETFAKTAA